MAVLADEFQTELFLLAGLKANLPTLPERAPAYCIDTNELFIGTAAGNKLINRGMTLAELTVLLNGTYAAKAIESTALLKSGGRMTGNLTQIGRAHV